jgi:hypothetical protein
VATSNALITYQKDNLPFIQIVQVPNHLFKPLWRVQWISEESHFCHLSKENSVDIVATLEPVVTLLLRMLVAAPGWPCK